MLFSDGRDSDRDIDTESRKKKVTKMFSGLFLWGQDIADTHKEDFVFLF